MASRTLHLKINGDLTALRRQLDDLGVPKREPLPLAGWLAPRRSPLVFVERSRGFVHLWLGAFGLHLARPLHKTRPDFCSDWWR